MKQITYDLSNITEDVFSEVKKKAKIAVVANKNAISPIAPTDNALFNTLVKEVYGKPNISREDKAYLKIPCVYIPVQYGNKRSNEPLFFDTNSLNMFQVNLGNTTWFDPASVPDTLEDFKKTLGERIEYDLQLLNKQEVVFDYLYSEFPDKYEDELKEDAFAAFQEEVMDDVGLAFTTDEETNSHEIQAMASLLENTISISLDGNLVDVQKYKTSEEFIDKALSNLDFFELTNGNPNVQASLQIKAGRQNIDDPMQNISHRKKLS